MSVQIGARFRPVSALQTPLPAGGDAITLAKARWNQTLKGMVGVQNWTFTRSAYDPPMEPAGVLEYAGGTPPVDVTMIWDSVETANGLFGNKDLLIWLWGAVAATPAVHVAGTPQLNSAP